MKYISSFYNTDFITFFSMYEENIGFAKVFELRLLMDFNVFVFIE